MKVISSKENEMIKNIKRLKEKKYRDQTKKYIVEGLKMVKEAINEKANIDTIVINIESSIKNNIDLFEDYNTIYVTDTVFKSISDVTTPQGILAVIKIQEKTKIDYNADLILILDNLQDPGNLGTILRTVDSTALNQIIVSKGTVDAYNPKVIRSTMGAIFRVNVVEVDSLVETINEIKENGFEIVATDLNTEDTIYEMKMKKEAIIIGNEANGVSKEVLEIADKKVKIPMLRKNRKPKCSSSYRNYLIRICKS